MAQVQVVLLKDVPGLGQEGELVRVKLGYFLLPKKLVALPGSAPAREILSKLKEKKTEKSKKVEVKREKKVVQEKKQQVMKEKKAKLLSKKVKKVV